MITERSPLSFSQVNSHILGGHEEGLCSNQDNQYLIIKIIIKLHPGCIRSLLVISSPLHLMMMEINCLCFSFEGHIYCTDSDFQTPDANFVT